MQKVPAFGPGLFDVLFLYFRFNTSDPAFTAKVKVKKAEKECAVNCHCCIAFSNVQGKMRMSRGKLIIF
jgi:hypothetical protein